MKKIDVTIKVVSPIHLSSGQVNVNIDADIVHDAFGFPYFPAKRFKGLLYEIAASEKSSARRISTTRLQKKSLKNFSRRRRDDAQIKFFNHDACAGRPVSRQQSDFDDGNAFEFQRLDHSRGACVAFRRSKKSQRRGARGRRLPRNFLRRLEIFVRQSRNPRQKIVRSAEFTSTRQGRHFQREKIHYESIDAGQNFCGEILGDEKILRKLLDGLNLNDGKLIAYVGRSHFTQYGKCLLTFGDVEKNFVAEKIPDTCYLRLDTPLLSADDFFLGAKKILQREVVDKLGENIFLGKIFASCTEVENFVVPWSMKRPRVMALAAEAVFEMKLDDAAKKILAEKIFEGFGTRTEEGFGQLRIWTPSKNFTVGELDDAEKISRPEKFSDDTISRAKKILAAHLAEQIRLYAHEDADNEKLRSQLKNKNLTHFFSRLDKILSNADQNNLRENFKAQLEIEIRDGRTFEGHLKNLYMTREHKFFDVLIGRVNFPRNGSTLTEDSEQIKKLRGDIDFNEKDFSDDKFFFEYLTNYFRFARKIAADEGRRSS